jgi:hypothetical protein
VAWSEAGPVAMLGAAALAAAAAAGPGGLEACVQGFVRDTWDDAGGAGALGTR